MSTSTPTRSPKPPPLPQNGSPDDTALPRVQLPQSNGDSSAAGPRRSSFNFLRRKSSSETRNSQRSASGGKVSKPDQRSKAGQRADRPRQMSKKQKALAQEEALRRQREAAMLPKQPPRLPSHSPLPRIEQFGGEEPRPDSIAIVSNRTGNYGHNFSRPSGEYRMAQPTSGPAPPMPGSSPSYMDFDPYPRTESMTHRGRYSYASSAISSVNSPRRVRRRKDPTPFK